MTDSRRGNPIETYSGTYFYPLDPRPDDVHVTDVAHGLANTCRYAGQCKFFYPVALHSVYVSRELEAEYGPTVQLYGLFHDAAEAYVTDVPRPIKGELEGYEEIERNILDAVWDRLDVAPPIDEQWQAVMDADERLFRYEADELLSELQPSSVPRRSYELSPRSPKEVRETFLARAKALGVSVQG